MMFRRSTRAHDGDGRKTVACCAAERESRAPRHIQSIDWMALTGDDHVN